MARQLTTTTLLNAVTTTGTGPVAARFDSGKATFQATVTGTGSVSATVIISGSNDGVNFLQLGTIPLSGTTTASDGFTSDAPWAYVQANCTVISGTGAAVTALMGY